MDTRASWYANPAVQEAIKRFILALVILSLALLGYDVEITRTSGTAPMASEVASGSAEIVLGAWALSTAPHPNSDLDPERSSRPLRGRLSPRSQDSVVV